MLVFETIEMFGNTLSINLFWNTLQYCSTTTVEPGQNGVAEQTVQMSRDSN